MNETGNAFPEDGLDALSVILRRHLIANLARANASIEPERRKAIPEKIADPSLWVSVFEQLWDPMSPKSIRELMTFVSILLPLGSNDFSIENWRETFSRNWLLLSENSQEAFIDKLIELTVEERARIMAQKSHHHIQ